MKAVARIFDSEAQARDAAHRLEAAGYDGNKIFVMAPAAAAPGQEYAGDTIAPAAAPAAGAALSAEALMEKVKAAGEFEITRAIRCQRALAGGQAVVIVGAPYGYVVLANQIMDDCGAAPAALMAAPKANNPSPFSDFLGIPCLERGLSFLSSDNPLTDSNWTFFPVKLRNKTTFGVKLSSNAAWLSSKIGLKTLSKEKPWRTSFGFRLLTNQSD